jgi:hypothetical protein
MKKKTIALTTSFILGLLIVSSFSVIGLNVKNPKITLVNNNGVIRGRAEMQGKCIEIPVSDIKIGCGRNFWNYEVDITCDYGGFEFTDLYYDYTEGTTYYIWILSGQNIPFPDIQKITLNENNPEEYVYIWIYFWWPWQIENFEIENQHYKNTVYYNQ